MKQKNTFTYILVAVSVIIIAVILLYAIGRNDGAGNDNQSVAGDNVDATIAPTIQGTEVPQEIVDKVETMKKHILENGYEDEDGTYYLGYMYGDTMYCSFRYDKESDMLCAQNSYYTQSVNGDFVEVLAVLDNFPYLSSVEYYEDYFVEAEDDAEKANSGGTFVAIAGYVPSEITTEISLNFYEMETSTYEYENLDNALNIAGQYSVKSFSMWDEVLELEFGYNLKDFGFENFVREDNAAESAE